MLKGDSIFWLPLVTVVPPCQNYYINHREPRDTIVFTTFTTITYNTTHVVRTIPCGSGPPGLTLLLYQVLSYTLCSKQSRSLRIRLSHYCILRPRCRVCVRI